MRKTIFGLAATAVLMAGGAAQAGDVTVTLNGVQARGGTVMVALQTRDQFMRQAGFAQRIEAPAAGPLTLTFADVPAGDYALSAFHDEDGDQTMDASDFGIPLEGWAMSNGDSLRSSPTFDLVKVPVAAEGGAITETMHYWDGQAPGMPAQ